ncbi:MAG: polysaccharide biosynthesis protein [Bacteroidetes bacterium]|nr:polysaccharide biosynthesis protein [Bacteroidota bacterium]
MFNLSKISPRWFIFCLDFLYCLFSWVLVFINWFFFIDKKPGVDDIGLSLLSVCIVFPMLFYGFKLYSGIIRFTGFYEVKRIFLISLIGSFFVYMIHILFIPNEDTSSYLLYSIYGFTLFTGLVAYRFTVKYIYRYIKLKGLSTENIVIYGAELSSVGVKAAIKNSTEKIYHIKAFIDDTFQYLNKSIDGIPVISTEEFKAMHKKTKINRLIVASLFEMGYDRADIFDFCVENNIGIQKYLNLSNNQVSTYPKINIEELLARSPIKVQHIYEKDDYQHKKILITGAAGSIGSELARQMVKLKPGLLILCDQAETPLNELMLDLADDDDSNLIIPFLASVADDLRMNVLFQLYRPEIIFHAAAYKHVPVMESFPTEALKTNVLGTSKLADLAVKFKVSKFIMISTDKAVNPTNVMGASKRIAEMYIQSLSQEKHCPTAFITTRFGNVLGSNGSVVERFKKQIEAGGPVTVTHPDIIRFFMTVSEACQLVLEAGTMGKGGEIFTFDMGKPVKIVDLAKKMIHLAGKIPDKEIKIHFSGLRPGEKLYEELNYTSEQHIQTYHKKIFIARVPFISYIQLFSNICELENLLMMNENEELLVRWMKTLIPEFISKNSRFEVLDVNEKSV